MRSGPRRPRRGRLFPFLPGLVLPALGVACGGGEGGSEGADAALDFPPPPASVAPVVSADDFIGAEACAGCHADQYQAWAGSTHGRAGGSPGPDVVIAPFNGRPIRFADATVTPRIRGGTYEFVVRQGDFDEQVFRVDGVIGRAHMLGGGTQGFLTLNDDGTRRFLPWDWSGSGGTWFCNTGSRTDLGWEPITTSMRLADCGDWPPLRPIGTVDRFANCQECHGSQIRTQLDPGTGFTTQYTTLQVNCESCHGPAREHVERASSGQFAGDDIGVQSLAFRDKDEALGVCFQCHALKDVLEEGYLPGEPFEEYYALKYPVLGDQPYAIDGRVRTFAYQANHLASACYLQGPMDCASCHEPHGQGYWDVNRTPLPDPFADGQCTSCHASKAVDVQAHTFHEPSADAPGCVSCHMPYLQHPEVGEGVRFARSDHTIAIPRPVFDADIGVEGACIQCHEDRSALELEGQARQWWGEFKPHRAATAGMASEFRARNLAEAGAMLLHPDEVDPLLQFQGLSRLLSGYLRPDDPGFPAEIETLLLRSLENPDIDVRSLAAASLHWARGDDPAVRARLVEIVRTADADRALRGRWLLALGFLGDRARDQGDFPTSAAAYRKALELSPDNARVLSAIGQMHSRAGEYPQAIDAIRRSLALDPEQPLGWVNLGIALAGSGDPLGARDAYAEALALNPHEALAHFNLGNSLQLAERYDEAVAAYTRAIEADPGLGLGHFELARTFIRLERFQEALPHARRAAEFLPDNVNARQMLADLERAFSGRPVP